MKTHITEIASFIMAVGIHVAFGAVAIPSEDQWPLPIYTVDVSNGPIDLQSATVSKYDGATTTQQTGIDAGVVDGTIVKKGLGELRMSVERASFRGQVHVVSGVIRVNCKSPLGGVSATNYVHSGATLVADYSQPVSIDNSSIKSTVFFAGGTGAAGMNGQYVMIPRISPSAQIRAPFAAQSILGADTTWNLLGNICLDSSKEIDLQGHELTIKQVGRPEDASYTLYVDKVFCRNPGGIVFDHLSTASIRTVGEGSFLGAGYFAYRGTPLTLPESLSTKNPMDWRLVVEDQNLLTIATSGSALFDGSIPNVDWLSFGGLDLPSGTSLILKERSTSKACFAPIAFMGPVVGGGGIVHETEYKRCEGWLITLGCPDNTFSGGVDLWKNCRLDLLGGGNALPAAGGDVKLADGGVLGIGGSGYTLPGAQFDGNVAVSNTAGFASGVWTKPIVKTGAGVLDYMVGIGGPLLDIREGTVRFGAKGFAPVAGLNKGRKWFADYGYTEGQDESKYYRGVTEPQMDSDDCGKRGYHNDSRDAWIGSGCSWENDASKYNASFEGSECWTNAVANALDIAYDAAQYKKHPRYCVYTYTGYIWNDSTEDATWTVASAFNDHQTWKLNGSVIYKKTKTPTATNNPTGELFTVTLHPGPNAIEVRTYSEYVSAPHYLCCATNGFTNVTIDFGIGFAKEKTESKDINDYMWRFEDSGDGSLFTREDSVATPRFEKLRFAAGTTLDLNAGFRANHVKSVFGQVEGAGTILGGNVTIEDSVVVVPNAEGVVGKLTVEGKVIFAKGAKVSLAEGMKLAKCDEITVLEAAEVMGTPELDSALADGWKLQVDATTVKLKRCPKGIVLIVR